MLIGPSLFMQWTLRTRDTKGCSQTAYAILVVHFFPCLSYVYPGTLRDIYIYWFLMVWEDVSALIEFKRCSFVFTNYNDISLDHTASWYSNCMHFRRNFKSVHVSSSSTIADN